MRVTRRALLIGTVTLAPLHSHAQQGEVKEKVFDISGAELGTLSKEHKDVLLRLRANDKTITVQAHEWRGQIAVPTGEGKESRIVVIDRASVSAELPIADVNGNVTTTRLNAVLAPGSLVAPKEPKGFQTDTCATCMLTPGGGRSPRSGPLGEATPTPSPTPKPTP